MSGGSNVALWTWWAGDEVPDLAPIPGFSTRCGGDADGLARLTSLDPDEVRARMDAGHRIYVAELDGSPVAYGWAATLGAAIGELDLAFSVPATDRYLWDFATLPAWRGRGVYPRLLQAILVSEGRAASRFWIINAPENRSSAAGIAKAGFRPVGVLSFLADRRVGAERRGADERARIGTALLGVPLLEAVEHGRVVAPCWRCVIAARRGGGEAACWPYEEGVAVACTCA